MSTISASTTSTTAYKVTADTTGALVLQTGATPTTAVTISSAQVVTLASALAEASGGTGTTTGYYGFKNRIINGAMVIDQRNAGAASTSSISGYFLDRWNVTQSTTGKLIAQQNAGSVTPPTGFINYLGVTSQSAYSIAAGDYYRIYQPIEGLNMADLAWGTASAATVTLSFWVRSSLTGTFGGALQNNANNRSYPFSYTISSANTWEQKTITIVGDTSGTWLTTNGVGMYVFFGLGVGSTYSGTAGSWAGANYMSATGATSVVGTSSATFYITGVQLEKGSTATSFDYRPYGTEFQLCQRYYEQWSLTSSQYLSMGFAYSATAVRTVLQFEVPKRSGVSPSFSGSVNFATGAKSATITSFSFDGASATSVLMYNDSQTGFTTGQAYQVQVSSGSSATVSFSAEL
jgi:hypothetical protein